jgi:hypothetical protein
LAASRIARVTVLRRVNENGQVAETAHLAWRAVLCSFAELPEGRVVFLQKALSFLFCTVPPLKTKNLTTNRTFMTHMHLANAFPFVRFSLSDTLLKFMSAKRSGKKWQEFS